MSSYKTSNQIRLLKRGWGAVQIGDIDTVEKEIKWQIECLMKGDDFIPSARELYLSESRQDKMHKDKIKNDDMLHERDFPEACHVEY